MTRQERNKFRARKSKHTQSLKGKGKVTSLYMSAEESKRTATEQKAEY